MIVIVIIVIVVLVLSTVNEASATESLRFKCFYTSRNVSGPEAASRREHWALDDREKNRKGGSHHCEEMHVVLSGLRYWLGMIWNNRRRYSTRFFQYCKTLEIFLIFVEKLNGVRLQMGGGGDVTMWKRHSFK